MIIALLRVLRSILYRVPEYTYPFPEKDKQGHWHFLRGAYEIACKNEKHNCAVVRTPACPKLLFWEQFWILVGGFKIWAITVGLYFFVHELLAMAFVAAFAAWVTYEEFVYQPRKYGRLYPKSFIDWAIWVVPSIAFLWRVVVNAI